MDVFEELIRVRETHQPVVLAVLTDCRGSTPRKPGARMLVFPDGTIKGTVGGGRVESAVIEEAQKALLDRQPRTLTYQQTAELAMCCGGEMTFFIEPLVPPAPLLVFGCGHVGRALLHSASQLDFSLVAIDDLETNLSPEVLPSTVKRHPTYELDELQALPFGPDCSIVIATRDHQLDQKLLEYCIQQEFRYLGVIGSKRKAHMQRERLTVRGVSEERIARIQCPIGIDIGAQSPEEIAISICAQLVEARHNHASTP